MDRLGNTATVGPSGMCPQKESNMKTRIFLLLLSALTSLASDLSVRVERGLNVLRTWTDGALSSETKQLLSESTNLFEQDRFWQSGSWTQRVSQAWYSGAGTMMLQKGWSLEWSADGIVSSNAMDPDSGSWTVFSSGGSQGAMTVVNGNERTQIINAADLRAEWRTNGGFAFVCPDNEDRGTLIFWYRTNAVSVGLPWFIAASCELTPGEKKTVRIGTPVDCIWKFMGTDKCFKCGEPCWLAGWPESAAKTSSLTASSYGSSLRLSFSGTPGVTYALQESFNLRDWTVRQIVEPDRQGGTEYMVSNSAGSRFFRVQAMTTATMNEEETRLAVEEIRSFNLENPVP